MKMTENENCTKVELFILRMVKKELKKLGQDDLRLKNVQKIM